MLQRLAYVWLRNLRVRRFLTKARSASRVQSAVLMSKVARHADSDFGRDHGFSQIRSVADFRRQVPISGYDYYRPYIDRVKRGDLSAMFGPKTRLLMFALTSGTTNYSKFIPVTEEFFQEYRRGWNMWGVRTYLDHPDLLSKKTIQLSSDWKQFFTEGGTPCGNISGLAAATAPRISNPIFILPRSLIQISHTASKQYAALRLSLPSSRVGIIITANPSTLVEFARVADRRREELIRDIFDGTLSSDLEISDTLRQSLQPHHSRPDRQRARELEEMIETSGKLLPRDFWPNMSVLAVWTGGSVGAYLPRLREYYGETAFRDHGLSASEGRMTVPLQDSTSAGVADFVHHYLEFIPEDEHGTASPTVLGGHELEIGKNYFILLTTSSGLYRYDIQDVVRCVDFEGEAPVLEFLNKGSHISSVTGEKLSEFQVVSAVKDAFAQLAIPMEHFTVAPVFGDPPGYVLLGEKGCGDQVGERLAACVDRRISELNCEYADRLETGRLRPLSVVHIERGAWADYRGKRIAQLGGSLEQYKHPCLVTDLGFVDRMAALSPHRIPVSAIR